MQIGEEWVYRPKARTRLARIFCARIEKIRPGRSQKIQIRIQDGEDAGLIVWVPKVTLRVPWEEREAWARDEERYQAAVSESWAWFETNEYHAAHRLIEEVLRTRFIEIGYNGPVRGLIMVHDMNEARSYYGEHLDDILADPLTFTDRHGVVVAPSRAALRWAQHACSLKRDTIMAWVEQEAAQIKHASIHGETIRSRGEEHWIEPEVLRDLFDERNEALDVLRKWCGAEAAERYDELTALREEVVRLNEILESAMRSLRNAGRTDDAEYLQRRLGYRPDQAHRPSHRH